jgi:glycosyltransferase involved in cell wall biosynthesis
LHVALVQEALPEYRRPLFDLLARRHRVHFFFTSAARSALPEGWIGVKGLRIPEMSDYVLAPGLFGELARVHKSDPFDVVLLPDLGYFSCHASWLFCRSARIPYVLWTGEWFAVRHPRRWAMRPLERTIAKEAAACLAYGSRAQQRLGQLGVPDRRVRTTGNASDYCYSAPPPEEIDQIRRDWSIGDRHVVLFLGRVVRFKGPDLLLEAFAEIGAARGLYLVVAGQGPELPALQGQARRRGVANVHFTGRAVDRREEKDLLYGLAEVFVLPSRPWRVAEPWGLVLNEAASASLPIVTTRWAGAVGDLIRDGETGFVIPAEDPGSLRKTLLEILDHTQQAKERGRRAREAASGFTIERMADAFDWGFQSAVDNK